MDRIATGLPASTAGYNWSGVIEFLITQYRQISLKETEWELEKKDLHDKVVHLEATLKAQEGLNVDLMRRVKMLEVALKKERMKFAAYLSKSNQSERDQILSELTKTNYEPQLEKIEENFSKERTDLELSKRRAKRQKDFLERVLKEFDCTDILQEIEAVAIDNEDDKKSSHAKLEEDLMDSPIEGPRGKGVFAGSKFERTEAEKQPIRLTSSLKLHSDEQKGLSLLDDGRKLASVGLDGRLCVLSVDQLLADKGEASLLFSSDDERLGIHSVAARGHTIFTGSPEGKVRLWEVGKTLTTSDFFDYSEDSINNLRLHPSENILLISTVEGKIRFAKFKTGSLLDKNAAPNLVFGQSRTPQGLSWAGQGKLQFAAGVQEDSELYFFDLQSPKPTSMLRLADSKASTVRTIASFPKESLYVAGAKDGRAYMIDTTSNKVVQKYEVSSDSITAMSISADGHHIAFGSKSGIVKIWDRRTTKTLAQREAHKTRGDDGVTSLVLLKDHLISGGADSYLMVYSLKDLY